MAFDLPDTLDQDHLVDWLLNLPAAHKLISTSGSITLAGADADTLSGTFSGTAIDVDNIFFFVNIDGGQFDLSGADVSTAAPAAAAAPILRAAPNPFNPLTEIRFRLPAAAVVEVGVYDAAGRLVRTLHEGGLPAGEQSFAWDGRGRSGERVAAGTYLVRARGGAWEAATRVTLVP
ncbi:MAG: FlgD immunoglobulin-like domain containing protein [Candidatus Krumholzibacteriia bacterium]